LIDLISNISYLLLKTLLTYGLRTVSSFQKSPQSDIYHQIRVHMSESVGKQLQLS